MLLNFGVVQKKGKPKPNRIFARYVRFVGTVIKPRIPMQTTARLTNLHFAKQSQHHFFLQRKQSSYSFRFETEHFGIFIIIITENTCVNGVVKG